MVLTKQMVIDADAHVIETDRTWDYMQESELKYRPFGVSLPPAGPNQISQEGWVVDGSIKGLRFPRMSDEQLDARSKLLGRDQRTAQESREMGDIDARLRHM